VDELWTGPLISAGELRKSWISGFRSLGARPYSSSCPEGQRSTSGSRSVLASSSAPGACIRCGGDPNRDRGSSGRFAVPGRIPPLPKRIIPGVIPPRRGAPTSPSLCSLVEFQDGHFLDLWQAGPPTASRSSSTTAPLEPASRRWSIRSRGSSTSCWRWAASTSPAGRAWRIGGPPWTGCGRDRLDHPTFSESRG
jgi:hypothetical protein